MPSISSRPSASTMRLPSRCRDRKRRRRGLHLRIRQPDMIEAGRRTNPARPRLLPCFHWHCRTFSAFIPVKVMHCASRLCRGHHGFRRRCVRSMNLPAKNLRRWSRRSFAAAPAVTARAGIWAERDGRRLLSFSCNDYLNLSQHPDVIAAAIEATTRYGVGAGASRLVTGNHPLYARSRNPAGAA